MKNQTQKDYIKATALYQQTLKRKDWTALVDVEDQLYKAEEALAQWALRHPKLDANLKLSSWTSNTKQLLNAALKLR